MTQDTTNQTMSSVLLGHPRNSKSLLSLTFVFSNVITFLPSHWGVPCLANLLQTSKQVLAAFHHFCQWKQASKTTNSSSYFVNFALTAWKSYADMPGPSNWHGSREHSTWINTTLVPSTPNTRVSHLNGQTLRARGTSLISVGRKITLVHDLRLQQEQQEQQEQEEQEEQQEQQKLQWEIQISPTFPIVQAAVHSKDVCWGARRSGGNFMFLKKNENETTITNPLYDPHLHDTIPTFYGCDFLSQVSEPTLVVGCTTSTSTSTSITTTASSAAFTSPTQHWMEASRLRPDGSVVEIWRQHVHFDQCKGGVLSPSHQSYLISSVGRSTVSLYDVRSRSPSSTMRVCRSSMGTGGPARAAISPDGTFVVCIADRTIDVYDFRKGGSATTAASIGTTTCTTRKDTSKPLMSMPFIAGQKPVAVCWMPVRSGFSVASGNSTGDVHVHDCKTGSHTGTLFNRLRSACVSLSSYDDGICSQNANGTVNLHHG